MPGLQQTHRIPAGTGTTTELVPGGDPGVDHHRSGGGLMIMFTAVLGIPTLCWAVGYAIYLSRHNNRVASGTMPP